MVDRARYRESRELSVVRSAKVAGETMHRYLLMVFVLLPAFRGICQVTLPQSDFLSVEDGLSQSTVHAIVQDSEGYMWFGTEDGLNRYDGYHFTVIHSVPGDSTSLSDNYITALVIGRSGTFWVGTKKGLNAWQRETESTYPFGRAAASLSVLDNAECTVVYEDGQEVVWVGTPHGLLRFVPRACKVLSFVHKAGDNRTLKDDCVRCICEDSSGVLWVGTETAIHSFDAATSSFVSFALPGKLKPWTLCVKDRQTLFVGTDAGTIFVFDKVRSTFGIFPQKDVAWLRGASIWAMTKDRIGNLWAGTGGSGLLKYSSDGKKGTAYTAHDNYVLALYEDRSDIMWTGTGKGIHRIVRNVERFKWFNRPLSDSRLAGDIWSFCECKSGVVWVGTEQGIARYDTTDRVFACTALRNSTVYALLEDHAGVIWAGTPEGLFGLDANGKVQLAITHDSTKQRSLSDNTVSSLCEDRDGELWIGLASGGLQRLNEARDSIVLFICDPRSSNSLSSDYISCIVEDRSGLLWIGTYGGGLNCYDRKENKFKLYASQPGGRSGLSSNRIHCIHEDGESTLWIGTAHGLNRFDKATGTFTAFHERDGLPNEVVYGILESSHGYLWLSTNRGISRFDPSDRVFRNFSIHDGLQASEFNHGAFLKTRRGEMLLGGVNGFNSFYPDEVQLNPYPPPVVFTEFKVFDRSVSPAALKTHGNAIDLLYSENFFLIEFAALDYVFPGGNKYAYRLEGLERQWVNCGTRRNASYTNLDPGEYVFRVRACNSDGTWNLDGAFLVIRIVPPFWRRWWFQSPLIAVVVLAAGYAIQRRFALLRQRTRAQQELSRQILESQERERQRIGNSLHDSLGQNLLVIKNLAVMTLEAMRSKRGAERQVEEISSLASSVLAEVREISYDLRPHHLDQLGLTGALRSIISRVEASSPILFSTDLDNLDNLLPPGQDIHLFRIVQEGLNNIIKHSRATRASVHVKRAGEQIRLVMQDNGEGFGQHRAGFGLTGMAERARILGGAMEVQSKPGAGTVISVTIPLGIPHVN
jgi:signal transduction histidine kinase/ligand-binding sensor domain-containing protein